MTTKLRIIPKKKLPLDNFMDTLIMLRLMGYTSPRAIDRYIDKKLQEIDTNDIVALSVETLHWNLAKTFAEDMAMDKARAMVNKLKRIGSNADRMTPNLMPQ
jgi:uncharacterized membrane-anchored protein